MSRKIGYARVSTPAQNLDGQVAALLSGGCAHVFKDHGVSAIARRRPGFEAALSALRPGDVLVVQRLDRAFRSVSDLVKNLEALDARGIAFTSMTEGFDTSVPLGRAMLSIAGALAQLEREIISERTKAGLERARAAGKTLGRPRALAEAA